MKLHQQAWDRWLMHDSLLVKESGPQARDTSESGVISRFARLRAC